MKSAAQNREIICKALRFDELQYCQMVMDAGYEWLHFVFKDDTFIIDETARLGLFWNWWKNQWEIREASYLRHVPLEFIEEDLTAWERRCALDLWAERHNPYMLNIMPNRWLKKEMEAILDKRMAFEFGIIKTLQNA